MQMVSDVPIGAFLSGGIDSSAVLAFMARHSEAPVKTYSIGFAGGAAENFYNELDYARQVGLLFNTDHHEILVRPDVVHLLPKLLWHMDEPIADSAFVTTYLVAEFARRDVKVGGKAIDPGIGIVRESGLRQRHRPVSYTHLTLPTKRIV